MPFAVVTCEPVLTAERAMELGVEPVDLEGGFLRQSHSRSAMDQGPQARWLGAAGS